jgi:hypothetical protein
MERPTFSVGPSRRRSCVITFQGYGFNEMTLQGPFPIGSNDIFSYIFTIASFEDLQSE